MMRLKSTDDIEKKETIDDLVADIKESNEEIESNKSIVKMEMISEKNEMMNYLSDNQRYYDSIQIKDSQKWSIWKRIKENFKKSLL